MAVGTIQPRYETNLGFRLLGRLITRPVNVGDLVAEGQAIAAIDPTALEFAVRSAKADLSKAEALLENAIGTEERKRILIKSDATTRQTLDDAEQIRAGAQASSARARANLAKAIEQLELCPGEGRLRGRRHRRERRGGTSRIARTERRDLGATRRPGGRDRSRPGFPRALDRRPAVHRRARSSFLPFRSRAKFAN